MTDHVNIMLCYARSGGTVLNQCLGLLPNVVVLSELNPLGGGWGVEGEKSLMTVKDQAKGWYGIDLKNEDFADSVIELNSKCEHLIIRDWSFVNFWPHPKNSKNPPDSLLILDELEGKCELRVFAFVRNSIDVFLSRGGNLVDFASAYLKYVQQLKDRNIQIFYYEEFCISPKNVLMSICDYCGLEYKDTTEDYMNFKNVHGDVQHSSRGIEQGKIASLPRIELDVDNIEFIINNCSDLMEANRLLGYPTSY